MDAMKISVVTRDLPDLSECVQACAVMTPSATDDPGAVRKFKYGMGRNSRVIQSVVKHQTMRVLELQRQADEMPAALEPYHKRRVEILEELCARDADGKPITVVIDGVECFTFDGEDANGAVRSRMDALGEEFADEIEAESQRRAALSHVIDDIMQEKVEIDVYAVPWSMFPPSISGSIMECLCVLCPDVPADCIVKAKTEEPDSEAETQASE